VEKLIEFGQHRGEPLPSLPTPYLLWTLVLPNVRAHHPAFVADALDVLFARLLADPDAVLAELLAPVPVDVIAQAKAKKLEANRARLAKLIAERGLL
jgi:hypothetical protein